jgi:hypothetical protein
MRGTAGIAPPDSHSGSQQIAQSGYLKLRPLTARTADAALATLIDPAYKELRNPVTQRTTRRHHSQRLPACRSCLDRSVCVWHSGSSDAGCVSGGRQGSKQSSNSRQFRRLQNPGGHRGPSGCCGHRCRRQAHPRRRYRCPGRVHVTRKHGPAVYLAANIAPARRSTTRKSSCENGNRGRAYSIRN